MKNLSLQKIALSLFIISLFLLGVIMAKGILIPLAISFLISYLLYPVVWRIERDGVHRIIAILSVILVTLVILAFLIITFSSNVSSVEIDLESFKEKLEQEGSSGTRFLEEKLGINMKSVDYYINNLTDNLISTGQTKFGKIFSATATTIFQLFILPVFTFFILFYRTKGAYFIFRLVGRSKKRKAIKILREISTVTPRYLAGLLGVVGILAVLNSVGLLIIGVPHAVVLGIGAAILNLIPYFGTLIGALIPLIYVLVSVSNPLNMVMQVVFMFIIVQFLENNIITPNVVGGNVKLNALTIILGLLFGNLIWGIAGMLIIIPYIAILKIIMRNIESLKPFAYLISNKGMDRYRIHYAKIVTILKNKITGLWRQK